VTTETKTFAGWVFQENLFAWLELVAVGIAYPFSSDELETIVRGAQACDSDSNNWYEYVLAGTETISLELGFDAGTSVAQVRVVCPPALLDRIRFATEVAQSYTLSR
jgi:hypothetical protein